MMSANVFFPSLPNKREVSQTPLGILYRNRIYARIQNDVREKVSCIKLKKNVIVCFSSCFNSFTAEFKNVVWDYFHVQYYTSF